MNVPSLQRRILLLVSHGVWLQYWDELDRLDACDQPAALKHIGKRRWIIFGIALPVYIVTFLGGAFVAISYLGVSVWWLRAIKVP